MKQIIISLIAFIGASLTACMAKDNEISETRNVTGFTAIHIDGVATVCFTQGDTYSCRVEGREKEVTDLVTKVKNGILIIDQRKTNERKRNIETPTIFITAPSLDEVELDGVGKFECKGKLKAGDIRFDMDGVGTLKIADLHCDNVKIDIDGVGKANVNVYCDHLKARVDGVSSLKLSGEAQTADIRDSFLGKADTRRLETGEYTQIKIID